MKCSRPPTRAAVTMAIVAVLCVLFFATIGWLGGPLTGSSNVAGHGFAHPSSPTEVLAGEEVEKMPPTPSPAPLSPSQSSCPPWNRTVERLPAGFNAQQFCGAFNDTPRPQPVRVWYGMMFSFELDMLEVVLHETSVVVDKYVIVESQASHAKKKKPLFLSQIYRQERFKPFLPQISTGQFVAHRLFRSGWDYEKRQRMRVMQLVQENGISEGDLLIANLDLDEVFSRKTVMRYKFCNTPSPGFHSFGFRYNLNCLQDESVSFYRRTVIYWESRVTPFYDLYNARASRLQVGINVSNVRREMQRFDSQLVWHMSTFGSLQDIRFKLSHSPHKFIHGNSVLQNEIDHCIHNARPRYLIELYPDMLPTFMRRNVCRFMKLGWIRSYDNMQVLA